MRNFRLSKYGFRLKLKGVLNVISWCGLIYYLIICAIGICIFFVPQFLVTYLKSLPDGISTVMKIYFNVIEDTMMCVGAVLIIWSVAWFGFFIVLQRNVAKKDIIEIRNLLAKSTFIKGGIINGVNLVFIIFLLQKLAKLDSGIRDNDKMTCCCLLMLLSIITVIFNSLMMNGVFHRKAKPVEVLIIFSHIAFILWVICLLVGTVVVYIYLKLIWVFLAGFILFLMSLLVYTLNISIILCLHSIILSSSTEKNNLPIFSRQDKQIMDAMMEKSDL